MVACAPESGSFIRMKESELTEHWYALVVKPRHEKAVRDQLSGKGYESFLPFYNQERQYAHRIRKLEVPLFPGYVFCRFNYLRRLSILTTPGVFSVVSFGREPASVEEREIVSLQAAVQAGVAMRHHPFLTVGQQVRVTAGALAGVEGIVVRIKEALRLVLSVTLLQRSVLLETDAERIEIVDFQRAGMNGKPCSKPSAITTANTLSE
jgi:transcription antitermination factor NusG